VARSRMARRERRGAFVIFKPHYHFEHVPPKPAAMEQILRLNRGQAGATP
jgi:hypothetical protein